MLGDFMRHFPNGYTAQLCFIDDDSPEWVPGLLAFSQKKRRLRLKKNSFGFFVTRNHFAGDI